MIRQLATHKHLSLMTCLSMLAISLAGCGGSELGLIDITGTVTRDGEPLPNVTVMFVPAPGESAPRGSNGFTDANGKYRLVYVDAYGIIPGKYQVELRSKVDIEDPANPGSYISQPETIPAEYNDKTTLTADVASGGPRTFDFTVVGIREKKDQKN